MRKVRKISAALLSVFMLFSTMTVCVFADNYVTLNTMNLHDEQIAGVSYELSRIDTDTYKPTEVVREWKTTTTADVINLPVGDYKMTMTKTPNNYCPVGNDMYLQVKDDGTITKYNLNYNNNKYNEVELTDNTLNVSMEYRDGFIIKNDTNTTRRVVFCQTMSKNVISMNDESAVITVYNADGSEKEKLSYTEAEKLKYFYVYETTLDKGEYVELYDRHVDGLFVYVEEHEGDKVASDVDGSINDLDNSKSLIQKITETVESKGLTNYKSFAIKALMNDPKGENLNTGGGEYMWGRSSIPNTVTISNDLEEEPTEPEEEPNTTSPTVESESKVETPTTSKTPNTKVSAPQTGDHTNVILWTIVFMVSIMGCAFIVRLKNTD